MILVDTDVISALAKVAHLHDLSLLPEFQILTTPRPQGRGFLSPLYYPKNQRENFIQGH